MIKMNLNKSILYFLACSIGLVLLTSCEPEKTKENIVVPPVVDNTPEIPQINYSVETQYPHDINSFTEGFLFHDGKLYESTGATENLPQTKSLFGEVDLKTGKIDVKAELDRNIYFGEGITFLNGKVFQLTYKNQMGFVYDGKTFKNIGKFTYTNREGWGLTTDGKSLIMSDGTSYITYLDPTSFAVTKTLDVAENNYVVENINELEYIKGFTKWNIFDS